MNILASKKHRLRVKGYKNKNIYKARHKKFGEGVILERKDVFLIVQFGKVGRKQLNLQMCLDKGLIEYL